MPDNRSQRERRDAERAGGIGRRDSLRCGALGFMSAAWALGSAQIRWLGGSCLAGEPRPGEPGVRRLAEETTQPVSSDAAGRPGFGRARSVVILFAGGGQSQLDLWDPKPLAPVEVRGAFDSIATRIPGARFCEHLPLTADVADRLTVVRSMSHEDLDHGSAIYLSLTGRYHRKKSGNPPPAPDDLPCVGSVLSRVRPSREFVQSAVHLNGPVVAPTEPAPGQFPGLLGERWAPLVLGDVASQPAAVPGLDPLPQLPPGRLGERARLLDRLDDLLRDEARAARLIDADIQYERAFRLLARPATRAAFNLDAEPAALREAYGRNRTGQSCLLARRLVEAGCPLTTVFLNHNVRGQDAAAGEIDEWGWDTHNDIFDGLQRWLLPRFDRAFSTFLRDLDDRGLLEETLVVCLGEFGRAPLVALEPRFAGASPGRKHWAACYSILFAGAGVGRGTIVGSSDSQGAYPASEPFGPWDTLATIWSALGIDPAGEYHDPTGRPWKISDGRVIEPLYTGQS